MSSRPVKVLLVHEDPDECLLMRDLLAGIPEGSYALDWAPDFETALQMIQRREHDVCLVNSCLGDHHGLELVHQAQLDGIDAPMILLANQGSQSASREAARNGVVDFLVKGRLTPTLVERAIHDALERKRIEAQLRQLAAFAQFNPSPVMEFTPDGTLTYFNDAARLVAESLGCESPLGLLPPEAPVLVRDCLSRGECLHHRQSLVGERTLSWCFFPLTDGNVVACFATDITERLSMESQLRHTQKLEAVGQLAAGVAHDFNNILTIIQGHAALLASNHPTTSPCTRPLREISDAAERAGSLIRQLLLFSRKQVLQRRVLDLNGVVDSAVTLLRRTVGDAVRLQVRAASGLPMVKADPLAMEQMLVNLAENARDAMPNGGVLLITTRAVEISPEAARRNPEARPGQFVCLSVSDTGRGMTPETQSRIFEPFFTTKGMGTATGLGLATVYGAAKQHQGWIEVQSEVGRGTVFQIYLPITSQPIDAPPQSTPPQPPSPEETGRGRETILVVEDEPALRELVVEILRWHGYQVHEADCGKRALEVWAAQQDTIDLVVTDMVMPGMMGSELVERLRREKPALKVIYTSGYSPGIAGKDLGLLEGFNFLPKPYPPSKLAQLVRECLNAPLTGLHAPAGKH
ncbi:MAG: response regulator [Verrucomicrobia bacterium]|nr:response regulator [Verrucomicrobiota bacterium]